MRARLHYLLLAGRIPVERRPAMDERRGTLARLWAILAQRCPRCLTGRVFRGTFAMNDPCPVCGQIFQREEGYFLGAMYVSYVLGCGIVGAAYLAVVAFSPDV